MTKFLDLEMLFWKFRPQTLAVMPDACIFLTSGMNLAFGLGHNYSFVSTHFRLSWFIGIIAGILLAAPLIKYLLKQYFVLLSSAFVVLAGILLTVWPDDEIKMLTARYINGIGVGLIIIPFIVHCSETIVIRKRGFALGIEQLCVTIGICIQATYVALWSGGMRISPTCLHGIICLALGLIALGLTAAVIESPIFHIRRHNEAEALHVLTRLELPAVLSEEKQLLLAEHKNYVFKNDFLGLSESFTHGLGPLFRMILYRIVVALTFSLPLNIELTIGMEYGSYIFEYPIIVSTVLRVLGVLTGMTMIDPIGRKIISMIALLVMAGLVIGVAILFANNYYVWEVDQMGVACVLLMLIQFFAGLYAPTATVYLSEAFPMLIKPFFIGICICLEYAVQILTIFAFRYNTTNFNGFNIFTSIYLFLCFILFLFTIPETRLTTLYAAQERFHDWLHWKSW